MPALQFKSVRTARKWAEANGHAIRPHSENGVLQEAGFGKWAWLPSLASCALTAGLQHPRLRELGAGSRWQETLKIV
jgi:hypothetical protein